MALSKGIRINYWMLGDNNSARRPEIREKIRLSKIGKHSSPETEFKKGHSYNKGRKLTDEHKEKLRKIRLGLIYPKKDTKIEIKMQNALKTEGIEFIMHHPIESICQADIFIKPNICIFCDGDWWHANPKFYNRNKLFPSQKRRVDIDEKQMPLLLKNDYTILRFWEDDIKNNLNDCLNKIKEVVENCKSVINQSAIC